MSKIRRKRASPEDLYKQCVLGADCMPDVKNKYEQNTLADILLKVFGSLVYFGGLGIGSGRGTGGRLGYRPLGEAGGSRSGRPITSTPVRPSVTVDVLGPSDIVPVDAETPAIVPLAEGTPDVDFVAPDAGPGVGVEELELYTITDSTATTGGVTQSTTVTTNETSFAVLDVNTIGEKPIQVFYDPAAPDTQILNVFTASPANTSDINIFVDSSITGQTIGEYESIPLERLDYSEFEIEEPPTTSTPSQRLDRTINRARQLYNRFVRQVPVSSAEFVTQPSRLVQFEFENAAYDADVSIEFERDLAEVAAAPDNAFRDVTRLHRPILTETSEGIVRVSRLAETGTITTRSGTTIGQPIHFYYDISEIPPIEDIELQTIAGQSNTATATIVDDILATTVIDPINATDVIHNDDILEDEYAESFNNAQLVIQSTIEEGDSLIMPTFAPEASIKVFVNDLGGGLFVTYPSGSDSSNIIILPNDIPVGPPVIIDAFDDYILHPAVIPKKRRRIELF